MKDSEKFFWAFITTFIVYVLGIFWHPFGQPTSAWHWIFWILMIFMAAGYFYCTSKEEKPEEEREVPEEDKE